MGKAGWTARDLPRMEGKIAVVTGANSGLGFETSRGLAGAGAHVVLGCRSEAAATAAMDRIRAEHPGASLSFAALDLASLASVRAFAAAFGAQHERLDLLVNNAGVMALPYRKTADGLEMQMGTNHFGHFALTGLLLDRLIRAASVAAGGGPRTPARVVTVSSTVHKIGVIRFDDLQGTKRYSRWGAYGQSKLANLLFTYQLDRRLRARGLDVRALASHPGYASTNLQVVAARMDRSSFMERFMGWANALFAQSAEMGALPSLFAAGAPEAQGGDYIGPGGIFELWGHPRKVRSNRRSHDEVTARRLWDVSEEITGVRFD